MSFFGVWSMFPGAAGRSGWPHCHQDHMLYDGDIERSWSQADWYLSAEDWPASEDSIHYVLMHKNSNPILLSVLFSTEINLVFIICWYLTKVLPVHLAEPHYVPGISAHCMSQLFKFPSRPQSSHIPCSNRDVLPTSNFLDLWYTTGILVT